MQEEISWQANARQIADLVRGVTLGQGIHISSGPGAQGMGSCKADQEEHGAEPGAVLDIAEDGIIVACGAGSVLLKGGTTLPTAPRMERPGLCQWLPRGTGRYWDVHLTDTREGEKTGFLGPSQR